MIVEEQYVGGKVCPMAIGPGVMSQNCKGSGCMAWRRFRSVPAISPHFEDRSTGYCGMAGEPGRQDMHDSNQLDALEREHNSMRKEQHNHE